MDEDLRGRILNGLGRRPAVFDNSHEQHTAVRATTSENSDKEQVPSEHATAEVLSSDAPTQPQMSPKQLGRAKLARLPSRKTLLLFLVAAIFLASVSGGYAYYLTRRAVTPPLPMNLVAATSFRVYYPERLPSGYQYMTGSAKFVTGLFSYKLKNGSKVITVLEQAAPPKAIDLGAVEGFTSLKVATGRAAIGQIVGNPSAIVITDSTLVNITSSKGVSKESVTLIAQKLKPVVVETL